MLCTLLFQINHLSIFVWHNYWGILACLPTVSLSEIVKEAAILHIGIVSLPGSRWSAESWGVSLAQLEPWSSLAVYCCSAWMEVPFGSLGLCILILWEKMRVVFSPHHIFQQVALKSVLGTMFLLLQSSFPVGQSLGPGPGISYSPYLSPVTHGMGLVATEMLPSNSVIVPGSPALAVQSSNSSSSSQKTLRSDKLEVQKPFTQLQLMVSLALCCMQTVFYGTLKTH